LVEIHREVAVGPHTFSGRTAIGRDLEHALTRVVDIIAPAEARGVEPEVAPTCLHARGGSLLNGGAATPKRRRVTIQIVAGQPAQQLVYRHVQSLALQIPQ